MTLNGSSKGENLKAEGAHASRFQQALASLAS